MKLDKCPQEHYFSQCGVRGKRQKKYHPASYNRTCLQNFLQYKTSLQYKKTQANWGQKQTIMSLCQFTSDSM